MWSAARWILRNSILKRVYQVTPSNVILRLCFSSECPCQSHQLSRVWNQVYKVILLFRNVPQTGLSHHRPVHQGRDALLSLSFSVRCMRPHFSELFRRELNGKSARRVGRARAVSTTTAGPLHFQHPVKQPWVCCVSPVPSWVCFWWLFNQSCVCWSSVWFFTYHSSPTLPVLSLDLLKK